MNRQLLAFTLLIILVVSGLVAGIFAGSIERMLTLPMMQRSTGNAKTPQVGHSSPPAATQSPKDTMVATTSTMVLAQDTFKRADQSLWGTASDGRAWNGDANTFPHIFSVKGMGGLIAHGQGTFNAVLGSATNNEDVLVNGTVNHFDGEVNLGIVLRWTNANNWYKAYIDGTHLTVIRSVQGVIQQLESVPFQASNNVAYMLRFRAVGAALYVRVWPAGTTEPQNWTLVTMDTALTTGQVGIRVLVRATTIVNIASFSATQASSSMQT
ncbi:hypothetical protein EPA93_47245 [Ktedonosporobacter rubrisoli]|uniref:DUF1080 domain-containing protein n=1 Tax=Ktedonosporobacter rubrisoli TaxID=2509675 RepID=A0A4P6K4C2_KTERU|nr:hypothetical protein [Ktedonosporobacter rubrisoli]QBD83158.1 hypothetical protein EPA93_47245 [Ktedonosporobacter rubrisoli]